MIPTLSQLISAVQGAWRLMLWDRDGLDKFDMTIEGFWRSFYAPLAALPAFILVHVAYLAVIAETAATNPDVDLPDIPATNIYLAIKTIAYSAEVVLFPLLMILVVRTLNLTERYVPFIIAWNWVNALIVGLLAIPHLLYVTGAINLVSIYGFQVIILGVSMICLYFATWASLRTRPMIAGVILAISIALGLTLEGVVRLIVL